MGNNIILETKFVADISGSFYIPSYQRGYRWSETEVVRLLDDIYQNGKKNYCLQPVVVRKKEDQYELIDGQQRLTTLYLIYKYMKQWLLTYTGSPKKMNKHYRERFHVDAVTAAKDLQELGVNYTQEQLDQIKQAEEQRLRQRRMEREAKERERLGELYEDCDGRFAFIAGYTDGGAPYGVMWEEVGIDPGLPFEEKVNLYHMQMLG